MGDVKDEELLDFASPFAEMERFLVCCHLNRLFVNFSRDKAYQVVSFDVINSHQRTGEAVTVSDKCRSPRLKKITFLKDPFTQQSCKCPCLHVSVCPSVSKISCDLIQ